ncbi:MAG: hypothetical protein EOO20_03065 [Chryseobacterium sp.]|nr:MAG: hypothetical protein EOO20_03065 [Chryseobacterium sp.]
MGLTTVAVYNITIHKRNQSIKDLEVLSDFDFGSDLIELFQKLPALLNDGTNTFALFEDKVNQKRLRINTDAFQPFGRCIDGELETGDYGVESIFIDGKGKDKGTIGKDDSPLMPFYFLCDIPKNEKKGYILLQRFKQFGVFTLFVKALRGEFMKTHPEYTISFDPITSYREFNRILDDAEIKKVSFQSRDSQQFSNVFRSTNPNDDFNPADTYLEVNLVAKRNKKINLMNSVRKIISSDKAKVDSYFQVSGLANVPLKVYFKANGRPYVLDTTHMDNFSPDIDISHLVKINSKGFPELADIKKASIKLLSDIKAEQNNKR